VDRFAEDSRPWWLGSPPVLVTVVTPTMVCAIASLLGLHALTPSVFVDVMACIMWVAVINDVLSSWGGFLAARRRFIVDGSFPFMMS